MSRERVAKLVLMLSSDSDGEVVNAARMIGKTLTAMGTDWHGLAAIITGSSPQKHHKTPKQQEADNNQYATERDLEMVSALFSEHYESLRTHERTFIKGIVMASRTYGKDKVFFTPRQRTWLWAIYMREAK